MQVLKETSLSGLLRTNESIFDLLSLGKSLPQSVNGNLKSFSLRYIDWEHPEKNVFHVAEEFAVERRGSHETRRPDLVLFVNGIPFGVIECKSPDLKDPITQAISQQIRNQKEDEIPALFQYAQPSTGVSGNEAKYATVGTTGQVLECLERGERSVRKERKSRCGSAIEPQPDPGAVRRLPGSTAWMRSTA